MMHKKNGITLVSALIIVIVISALAGVITISTRHILQETTEKEIIREYKLVESAVNDYIMRNSGVLQFEEIDFDLSTVPSAYLKQFDGEVIVDNMIDMYVIDLEEIGITNATYGIKLDGDEDDVYIVSKDMNTVYYKKGFEIKDSIYYKVRYD